MTRLVSCKKYRRQIWGTQVNTTKQSRWHQPCITYWYMMTYKVIKLNGLSFAVINAKTGATQSVWMDLISARKAARDLSA